MQGLLEATGAFGRHGARDRTLLLLMYRDGLRVTEANSLRWDQVDLKAGHLAVQRPKSGIPSIPCAGRRCALRQLRRDGPQTP
jgi:integrase